MTVIPENRKIDATRQLKNISGPGVSETPSTIKSKYPNFVFVKKDRVFIESIRKIKVGGEFIDT